MIPVKTKVHVYTQSENRQSLVPHFQPTTKIILLASLVAFFLSGCIKEFPGDHETNLYLVSSTKIGDFTKAQLDARYTDKTGTGFLAQLDKYDISVYKIEYKTKYINDSTIIASGAVIIPKDALLPSMMSIEHGDILNNEIFAPSHYTPGPINVASAYNEGSAAASNGYITVLPDYIGMGPLKI